MVGMGVVLLVLAAVAVLTGLVFYAMAQGRSRIDPCAM